MQLFKNILGAWWGGGGLHLGLVCGEKQCEALSWTKQVAQHFYDALKIASIATGKLASGYFQKLLQMQNWRMQILCSLQLKLQFLLLYVWPGVLTVQVCAVKGTFAQSRAGHFARSLSLISLLCIVERVGADFWFT